MKPSQELWHRVYEQSPIGIAFCANDGNFMEANDKFCSLLEYNIEEIKELSIEKITHPADIKSDMIMMHRLMNGEVDGYEMLKRYITKTGKITWARLTVWPVKEGDKMLCTIKQIQPINGDKHKIEHIGQGSLQVRPTLSIFEFIADNWKSFVFALTIIISTIIAATVQFRIMSYEISHLKQVNVEQQAEIRLIIDKVNKNP